MKWSRYNTLFKSKAHGWLLYNAASNSFLEISDQAYLVLAALQSDPSSFDFAQDPGLYFVLRNHGILVEETDDDTARNLTKLQRLQNNYDSTRLLLTIAPTRGCNFNCTYCYELHRPPLMMSDEVADRILSFIKAFKGLTQLSVTWYGGEPLLCFDRICSLTEQFKQLQLSYSAFIVTNGYPLRPAVARRLSALSVDNLQVTIDGPQAVHDRRRPLRGGGPTFRVIMDNLETLFAEWQGRVLLRVNIDQSNRDQYPEIHRELRTRFHSAYEARRLNIYPGIVHDFESSHPDLDCLMNRDEEALFTLEQYRKHGIDDLRTFPGRSYVGCAACRRNAFVIGPEGDVYKCWDEIGMPERQVGSLMPGGVWHPGRIAEYLVASSYLEDPECRECFYFPVCDGGCNLARLKNLKGQKIDVCSKFRNYLPELLEIHYERKQAGKQARAGQVTE